MKVFVILNDKSIHIDKRSSHNYFFYFKIYRKFLILLKIDIGTNKRTCLLKQMLVPLDQLLTFHGISTSRTCLIFITNF